MTKQTLKNTLILVCITLISGFSLGFVHELTKEPIEKQQQLTHEAACKQVFKNADSFDMETKLDTTNYSAILGKNYKNCSIDEVIPALDADKKILGYVLTATCSEGYGGDITLMVGITTDNMVNGIEFLTLNETAGLGMNAQQDDFKEQFADKSASEFTVTKEAKTTDDEIQALSSATITSKAVTKAVNAAIIYTNYIQEQKGAGNLE